MDRYLLILVSHLSFFFPKQVYLWGFYLRKKRDRTRWWARWAVLGADLAVLGALGWVRRGIWPCWARWAGLGADLAFCVWSTLYMS